MENLKKELPQIFRAISHSFSLSLETSLHSDVRGAYGRCGQLRLQDSGSDARVSQLTNVRRLTRKPEHGRQTIKATA